MVAVSDEIALRIGIVGLIVALAAAGLLFLLLRWQLGPLAVLSQTISRFVDRDFSQNVSFVEILKKFNDTRKTILLIEHVL